MHKFKVHVGACSTSLNIHLVVGVPDPPVIRLRPGMENILEWNIPLSRGPDILFYTVEAM